VGKENSALCFSQVQVLRLLPKEEPSSPAPPQFLDQTIPPALPTSEAEGEHSSHSHFLLLDLRNEQSLCVPWDPHVAQRTRRHLLWEVPRGDLGTSRTLPPTVGCLLWSSLSYAEDFPKHFFFLTIHFTHHISEAQRS
jgi:hypothetical protein